MDLNDYRDEAGDFLKQLHVNDPDSKYVSMLKEELELLVEASEHNNEEKLQHQLYDLLFIIFEMAAAHNTDLNLQWENGRKRKEEKYLNK